MGWQILPLNNYLNLFADDAKLMKVITNQGDCEELQRDIDKIYEWSKRWKLEFNTKKCHVMEMGKSKRRPSWEYKMGGVTILKSKEEKDLGVMIQDTLSPEKHINRIFGATYNLLANIRVAFNYLDRNYEKNYNKHDTSQIRICSCGVVSTQEKRHKETRKDTKNSYENDT